MDTSIPMTGGITLAQATAGQEFFGSAKAQLSTHDRGRDEVPVVVADGAPLAILQYLHTALSHYGPTPETDQRLLLR